MIIGHGVDLVQIKRIKNVLVKFQDKFVNRILTSKEQIKFATLKDQKKILYLATRFAGKEAFAKAIGIGIGLIAFNEIGILNNENGKPIISLSHRVNDTINSILGDKEFVTHISLSNTAEYAMASVLIEIKK